MKVRRRALTILEVMIVLAILSLVGSMVVFGIQSAKQKQLFLNESEQVLKAVKLSQDLMMILNADVSLKFKEGDNQILYWIEVEGAESDLFISDLSRPRPLKSIHVVEFDDGVPSLKETKELTLSFISGGSFVPKGVLRISTVASVREGKGLSRYIPFPGYPIYFRSVATIEEAKEINEGEQEGQEALLKFTVDEVNSLNLFRTPSSENTETQEKDGKQKSEPKKANS